jgi:hypothetical protein
MRHSKGTSCATRRRDRSYPAPAACARRAGLRLAAGNEVARVIYYVKHAHGIIWLLTMYPKSVADDIPAHVLRHIRKEVDDA